METVLSVITPDGAPVVLPAVVYAKILAEHRAAADLDVLRVAVTAPDLRRPDPRPGRERFFRRTSRAWILVVIDFRPSPAIIVTAFTTARTPR